MKYYHDGDCTIYSALINSRPEDGICTYGYGFQQIREHGDRSQLYSNELTQKLMGSSKLEKITEGKK